MTFQTIDGVEILLWPHSFGLVAFSAPWVFDLEYDGCGRGTVDAGFSPLNVGNYPRSIDRYRALDGPGRARVLKAALARRDDYRLLAPNAFQHYLVRHHQPGLDEAAFLRIVAAFIKAWRRQEGLEPTDGSVRVT